MSDFYNALIMVQVAGRKDLHLLYYFLRVLTANVRFIEAGHWASNSLFANPESDNPLYKIFNRPRLADLAPDTGMLPREIKGE